MFETILNFLHDFEDNGDIIESSYQILTRYLKAVNGNSSSENVRIMEQSKVLLSIGIKHTAVY